MESDQTGIQLKSPEESRNGAGEGLSRALMHESPSENDVKTQGFDPFSSLQNPIRKTRTALRLKYEAEAHLLKKKIGDLETIRAGLNLSQRKMCQLLLVDPSAWTRWTKTGSEAPPHIYRALQWFLALEEKYPALDPSFWLHTVARTEEPRRLEVQERELRNALTEMTDLRREITELREASTRLEIENRRQRLIARRTFWLVAGCFAFALALFMLLKK